MLGQRLSRTQEVNWRIFTFPLKHGHLKQSKLPLVLMLIFDWQEMSEAYKRANSTSKVQRAVN